MNRILQSIATCICLLSFAAAAHAQKETVATSYSETAVFGTESEMYGPYPWSDLGITASASITPGTLNVQTGGSTSFNLPTGTVTAGEAFIPGSTVLDLGYTPGFGSKSSTISGGPAASGNLSSNFVYNLGPFGSGSPSLLNTTMNVSNLGTANLSSGLNAGIGSAVLAGSASTPTVGIGLTAKAQICFFVCATVASVSAMFDVSGQTSQTVVATPTVTYGDLVWESTSQTYSASDTFTFVAGASGTIANKFLDPSSEGLSLSNGETFYYNFLPVVEVNTPVVNTAEVAVPASFTASYEILGAGSSKTWPLGDLYSLSTGGAFDFNPTFNGTEFYSIPLTYESNPNCLPGEVCAPFYNVGPGGSTITTGGGTTPGGSGPCGTITTGCDVSVPDTPGVPGGGGDGGPLGPGPQFNNPTDPCEPAGVALPAGYTCNQTFNQTPPTLVPTPEPSGIALLGVGLVGLAITSRRRLCS
jgi:hypothetical protein